MVKEIIIIIEDEDDDERKLFNYLTIIIISQINKYCCKAILI